MDTNSTVNNSENRIFFEIFTKYDVKTAKIYHVALTSQSNNQLLDTNKSGKFILDCGMYDDFMSNIYQNNLYFDERNS